MHSLHRIDRKAFSLQKQLQKFLSRIKNQIVETKTRAKGVTPKNIINIKNIISFLQTCEQLRWN